MGTGRGGFWFTNNIRMSHFSDATACGGGAGTPWGSMLFVNNGTGMPWPCATWDTWPAHYEQNGYDEDKSGIADQGVDGLDNASSKIAINGIVDDPWLADKTLVNNSPNQGERETMAPFPSAPRRADHHPRLRAR